MDRRRVWSSVLHTDVTPILSSDTGKLAKRVTDRSARSRRGEFLRFVAVGVGNTLTSLAVYALLVLASVAYVVAVVVAYAAALLQGYALNRAWTFRASGSHVGMASRYVFVQGFGLAVNLAVVAVLVESFRAPKIAAEAAALPAIVLVTFTLNRRWTFQRPR